MKKILLLGLLICLMPLVVEALNCDYNPNPFYEILEAPSFYCYSDSFLNCVAVVETTSGEVLSTSPKYEIIENYGVINYFECNRSCNIDFSKKHLRDNITVTFAVYCDSEDFIVNVTPQFKTAVSSYEVIDRGIWLRQSIPILLLGFFVLLIFIGLILFIWNRIK